MSDEESSPTPAKDLVPVVQRRIKRGGLRKRMALISKETTFSAKTIRHLVASECGCKCECFAPFRHNLFDRILYLREKLHSLPKIQADEYVGYLVLLAINF